MIKPLTSLRFFFAFMIFVHHMTFLAKSKSSTLRWIHESILKEGYIGVSFFFILSGFILAYNYRDSMLNKKISKSNFYIARIARIYPLHILTLLIAVPITIQNVNFELSLWFKQLFFNLTLTQSFVPIKKIYFSFNSPSWSISNELFFYLLFPFLILLISKLKILKYSKSLLIPFLLLLPILMLLIPPIYYKNLFYVNPFFRVFDFIIGILLFELYLKIKDKKKVINFNILEFGSILLLVVFFIFHSQLPLVVRYSIYYWLPMSFLILVFAFQKGLLSRLLSNNTLILLGEISFGFYMFHQLVLKYFIMLNKSLLNITNEYLIISIILIVSLIISYVSLIWFENPVNKYLKRVLIKKSRE
ncbi:Peptidoglycan/LPS O-acetylase OafA/YrhL, contains acyltransferase and SGNH-hydrolase domains [Flavobacterium gillisiae]|uniref:Peptidoglycan/LPS O-acetylase OafA/YrhL, contains acyltransferase and SGNH-hydrolase domains n=1 Tax=Flavobacterium gillisiae TaxID=150146 RepID=A0A1H4BPT9_9FLAO|nr:acyltransferase [Flavobacterium gillisiae]SEA49842.1 Peptidoglycan/LPS O-acetylase OafA/YrhL, contains acyltransferase and SGNH-hydrolase domains [Flavobacterium gillisiae]